MSDEYVSPLRTSPEVDKIAPALVHAQAEIESVVKDKTGTIQGKDGKAGYSYKYSDLSSVIEAVKKPLNANGICFLQAPARANGGIQVTTRLMHESGQYVEQDTFIPGNFPTPQSAGSAITYGKRYGLQSLSGLPSEDDDGKRANDDTERDISDAERKTRAALEEAAKGGIQALKKAWSALPQKTRDRIDLAPLKRDAIKADEGRKEFVQDMETSNETV